MFRRYVFSSSYKLGFRRLSDYLKISEEVSTAVGEGRGVVALESTVITHGMPYPDNVKTAKELESIVRRENCVPATVAVADGAIHVGITDDLMDRLGSTKDALKISRRDLAIALSRKAIGGTTVSATMIAAHMAGIRIFATGGIGGVHRGVDETMDISADLIELGRTPIAVVCAGIKSILDIPKTLEFLETQGAPVLVYGTSDEWPGFFTTKSGYKAPYQCRTVEEIARIIDQSQRLSLQHGLVIGVPIPETESDNGLIVQEAIEKAIKEAKDQLIHGRQVTPFLLNRLNELTGGRSLSANVALIKNNAMVASRIAKAYSQIGTDKKAISVKCGSERRPHEEKEQKEAEVAVIGGSIVDFYVSVDGPVQPDGSTHPGAIGQSCGGVGRNHADALSRLGLRTLFISAIGRDHHGRFVRTYTPHLDSDSIRTMDQIPTATYAGITSTHGGNLSYGVGCMRAHDYVDVEWVRQYEERIQRAKLLVLDANIPEETIRYACEVAESAGVPIWFDPTDQNKAAKICRVGAFDKLTYVSPNFNEFLALMEGMRLKLDTNRLRAPNMEDVRTYLVDSARILFDRSSRLSTYVITVGAKGVLVLRRNQDSCDLLHYAPPIDPLRVINVSGAGDCLNAGIIRGLLDPSTNSIPRSMDIGLACARASLQSKHPVPKSLNEVARSIDTIPRIQPILQLSTKL